ncbi:hypothetical protein [Halobacillus sp. Marseille-P3879]|nr:hypothetical protein [Halobacillus sp. Marseille-P3879]
MKIVAQNDDPRLAYFIMVVLSAISFRKVVTIEAKKIELREKRLG